MLKDSDTDCACRDMRTLSTGLHEVTGQPIRERFARLSQVVELLTLETVHEVTALWSDESIAWRLSPAEVKVILSWRCDFDKAEIAALQL